MKNIMKTMAPLLVALVTVSGAYGWGDKQDEARGREIILKNCEVSYKNSSRLGTNAIGILQECNVKLGDKVPAGLVIARLQSFDLEAQKSIMQYKSQNQPVIAVNESILAKHRERVESFVRLEQRTRGNSLVSRYDYAQSQAEAFTAERDLVLAQREQRLAQLGLAEVEADLRARQVVAPHAGTVVEVIKRVGERVNQSENVVHIVDKSILWITAFVDVRDVWDMKDGQRVVVRPQIAGVEIPPDRVFEGVVIFVDTSVDPGTQTCKVIAEVKNTDEWLKAGIDVTTIVNVK